MLRCNCLILVLYFSHNFIFKTSEFYTWLFHVLKNMLRFLSEKIRVLHKIISSIIFRKHDIRSNTSSTLCPVCGIIFPYMTQMKKHMEVEHGDECPDEGKSQKMALCTLCGKLLNNEYTLSNHMKKVHDPNGQKMEREFKCEVSVIFFKCTFLNNHFTSYWNITVVKIYLARGSDFTGNLGLIEKHGITVKGLQPLKIKKNVRLTVANFIILFLILLSF